MATTDTPQFRQRRRRRRRDACPLMGQRALAADKIKIGFIFLGPIGDYGWTWAHNKGREAIDAALGDKVETIYTENVPEDASAEGAIRDLCNAGCKLIFTTSMATWTRR